MSNDMTIAEVARSLNRIEKGMSEMREEMVSRIDRTVSADVYAVHHKTFQEDLSELRRDIDDCRTDSTIATRELRNEINEEAQRRVLDRRWWVAAVGIPVTALLLQYVAPLVNGGG